MRSFGVFMEELLTRYDPRRALHDQGVLATKEMTGLRAMVDEAMATDVALRPRFASMCGRLESL